MKRTGAAAAGATLAGRAPPRGADWSFHGNGCSAIGWSTRSISWNNGGGGGLWALVKQVASVRPHPRFWDTRCLLFQSVSRIAGLWTAPARRPVAANCLLHYANSCVCVQCWSTLNKFVLFQSSIFMWIVRNKCACVCVISIMWECFLKNIIRTVQ